MIIRYPLIHPSFDPPKGQTKNLFDQLSAMKARNENEGGGEIIAIADFLSRQEGLPSANYLPVAGGVVQNLCLEFLRFLCSFRNVKHPLLAQAAKRNEWQEIPLHICGLSSATAGITAVLMANGITSGEVITTSLNFVGVPNAILMAGCTPKFVDVNEDDLCVDVKSLQKAITAKTKAVVLVHFNQVVDLSPIDDLFSSKGLEMPLIQDASLAAGSTLMGMPAGLVNLGKGGATVYSFATSKILSGLGGGVVISHDKPLIERIQSIGYQGQNFSNPEELLHFGANFKMNDMNAVLVLEQLRKREAIFEKRRHLKALYDELLADSAEAGKIKIQKVSPESVVTHYAVIVPDRKSFAQRMMLKGIQAGLWHTAHLQKIYKGLYKTKAKLPVSESTAHRIAFLPFYTQLSDEDVAFICGVIKEII